MAATTGENPFHCPRGELPSGLKMARVPAREGQIGEILGHSSTELNRETTRDGNRPGAPGGLTVGAQCTPESWDLRVTVARFYPTLNLNGGQAG